MDSALPAAKAPVCRVMVTRAGGDLKSIVAGSCAKEEAIRQGTLVQSNLDGLVSQLEKSDVGRVEILHIPPHVLTGNRITPESLEGGYLSKLTIRDLRVSGYQRELLEPMRSLVARPLSELPDLRWAVLLFAPNGARIGAVYFSGNGKTGSVGSMPAVFEGTMFGWLQRSFAEVLR